MSYSLRTAGALAAAVMAALPLAACTVAPAGDPPPQTLSAGISPVAEAGVRPVGEANREMKTARPSEPSQLLVTGVRVGSHAGFDRVVFDLEGEGDPGWFVDYTANAAQQGSGRPIPFNGTVALNVVIEGTAYPFEVGRPDPQLGTVPGSGNVTQVVSAGTFEGRSQFIVGLGASAPYSVEVLNDPKRLVIDVAPN